MFLSSATKAWSSSSVGKTTTTAAVAQNEDFAPARMPRRAKSFSEEDKEEERPVGIFVGFEQRRTTGKILIDEE